MPPSIAKLTDAELEQYWTALSDPDAPKADESARGLIAGGDRAVALLRSKLRPKPKPDPDQVQQLIDQLDAQHVQDREKAVARLRQLGETIEAQLRQTLSATPSAETKSRIDVLLGQIAEDRRAALPAGQLIANADLRRDVRAIQALARIGTPPAIEALREAAVGPAGAARTRYARAALREP
jgi:hypothetical protein